jgi:transposase, IS5 family
MNIRHESIFPFETLLEYEPQTRLAKIFKVLNCNLVNHQLSKPFSRGPLGYKKASLLRALLAKYVYGIPNTAKLVERLSNDIGLRYDCGFPLYDGIPSTATFCRFIQVISNTSSLQEFFDHLVKKAFEIGVMNGTHVAIDSSKIDAYEKTVARNRVVKDGKHADWGSKQDTNGNQITWFGYKIHAVVDTHSELPIAITITPANQHDATQAIPLIDLTSKNSPEAKYFMMDSGYDSREIYENLHKRHMQAIIPLNLRGEKIPPEGLDLDRTPICSMGHSMVYWGSNQKTGELKFRCPHVCGKVDCAMGSQWCSSSNYGYVIKKYVGEDCRSFCIPHRGTTNWNKLYNKRTSVERFFSRLKEHLMVDNLTVGGIKKAKAHLLLSCIALIAGTLAINSCKTSQKTA